MQLIVINCFRYSSKPRNFDTSKNYYSILNIKPTSSKAIIRNAYLGLAKKYHPDINPQGKEKFTQIRQAYEVLSNEHERKQYDQCYKSHINPQPQFTSSKPNSGTAYQYKKQYESNQHKRQEYHYESFKGQRKMNTEYKPNFNAKSQQGKTYSYDDIFSKNEWTKQFYSDFKKTFDNSEKPKKSNKKKTPIDIQYERVQFTHSASNPFSPPGDPQQQEPPKPQVNLEQLWKKFKTKIVG